MKLEGVMWLSAYLATLVAAAGCIIGMSRWRALARGQKIISLWLGASALSDLLAYYFAHKVHDTQQVAHLWYLANVILGIEALASYQHGTARVRALRAIALAYLVIWIAFAVTVEPVARYSTFSGPLQGIVLLAASVVTILCRVTLGRRDFIADPGFLIAVALCAAAIPAAFQTVVAQLWLNGHPEMANTYYTMNNIVSACVAGVIIVAITTKGASAPGQGR